MTLTITNAYTTEPFTHSKTGESLTLLKVLDKLSKADYISLNALVRGANGYYSKFAKGFLLPCDVVVTGDVTSTEGEQSEVFNLFDACNLANIPQRTKEDIDNLVVTNKGNQYKNITAEVKKQLAKRFPMCKFSGNTRNYNSISIYIVSSPFDKNSDELKAILNYAIKLLDSYEYCTDYDPYGDYGSSYNFYGHVSIEYDYTQTQGDIEAICARYAKDVEAEEIEKDKRFEAQMLEEEKQRELDRIEYEKQEKIIKAQIENIENNTKVVDLAEDEQFFIVNAKFGIGKENSLQELKETQAEKATETTTKITRKVCMSAEDFENFCNLFLYDFSFLYNMGGSATDDARITSRVDYDRMNSDERATVEWYNTDCVAVYCDDELQFVIDPQGYNYARYVGFVEGCNIVETYNTNKQENAVTAQNKAIAEMIEDISFAVISENSISDWKESEQYKNMMIDALKVHCVQLSRTVIQQVENEDLKIYLYQLSDFLNSVQYQFDNVNIVPDEQLTIFKIGDFGGVSTSKIKYQSHENTSYAQYDDCVKIVCGVFRKRGLYSMTLKSSDTFVIVKGWHDLPEELLFDKEYSNSFVIAKSKYSGFDLEQMAEIKKYCSENDIEIIVNRGDK